MALSEEERKARKREYQKKYFAKPDVKTRRKEYESRLDVKARRRERENSLEYKMKRKEYESRPERIEKRREIQRSPEQRAKRRNRQQSPEYKAKTKVRRTEYLRTRPDIRAKETRKTLERRAKLRMEVCSYYSKIHSKSETPCCRCCGLGSHIEFLSVDHIAGRYEMDSEPELLKLGYSSKMKGASLLRWIKMNNFPSGFQVLCMNCNWAKGHSKDNKCPHEIQ